MSTHESPREVIARGLSPEASLPETLEWALAHACLAPSELNSQPWAFQVWHERGSSQAQVDLLLDEARALPVVDPDRREAVLACGAALLNLRLALRGAALGTHVVLCPDATRPELLARLEVAGSAVERAEDRPLREVIGDRSTHREAFDPGDVPDSTADHLVAEAAYEGALVAVVAPDERPALEALVVAAENQLWEDAPFRHEVASWSRTNRTDAVDGVPGFAHELVGWRAWLQPTLTRTAVVPEDAEEQDRHAVFTAPLLVVLGSATDGRDALLRAGAGLQRLLLRARANGLGASYLNAVVHVPTQRLALARLVQLDHPQVVLRLGYADPDRRTPRRSASAALQGRMSRTAQPSVPRS